MKCKNCKKGMEQHYVSINSNRKQKLKNIVLWCYPLTKDIKPTHKKYFMKFVDDSQSGDVWSEVQP